MLKNSVALVTGGAGGIGKATVRRFVEEGAYVLFCDVNEKDGAALSAELNTQFPGDAKPRTTFTVCDVSNEAEVERTVSTAAATYGTIHILVNNAVKFTFGHLLPPGDGSKTGTDVTATAEAIRGIMEVNLIGYANFIKHTAKVMKENPLVGETYTNVLKRGTSTIDARDRGSIINIASVSSFIAQPEFIPYNCSKGAVLQLSRCCAMDFAPLKIRVNSICPGTIETDGSHNHMDLIGVPLEQGRKQFGDGALLKRQAAPEEIGNVCVFLGSSMSSYMTGSSMVVDGGQTI